LRLGGLHLEERTSTLTHAYAPQDKVGDSLVQLCDVVPQGVLVFVTSYTLLDRMVVRWKVGW
jgi:Fanconi anemia group J protein